VGLLDKGALLDPMGKLREVYPNVMEIERQGLMSEPSDLVSKVDHRKMDVASLFADFYLQVTGEALTEEQASAFSSVVNSISQDEREESV